MSAPPVSPNWDVFRLDIELRAPERLPALQAMFERLRRIKEIQFTELEPEDEDDDDDDEPDWCEDDDPSWAALLDTLAVDHFAQAFQYDSAGGRVYRKLWELTHYEVRLKHPLFRLPGPWPFESVIGAIYSGEYRLVDIDPRGPGLAALRYDPLAGPFGGTESLVQLVEGFGQAVVFDSWNKGPPHREEAGWDYERAKALVAAGRGLE